MEHPRTPGAERPRTPAKLEAVAEEGSLVAKIRSTNSLAPPGRSIRQSALGEVATAAVLEANNNVVTPESPKKPSTLRPPSPHRGDVMHSEASLSSESSSRSRVTEFDRRESVEEAAAAVTFHADIETILMQHSVKNYAAQHSEACYFDHMMVTLGLGLENEQTDSVKQLVALAQSRTVRGYCYRIASAPWFRLLFSIVLVVDLAILAFEVDYQVTRALDPVADDRLRSFFFIADHIFTFIFLAEIIIRIVGSPVKPWLDPWILGEGSVVALSVMELWLVALFFQGLGNSVPSFTAFRSIRFIRGVRAIRAIKMFRYVKQLRLVAASLWGALMSIIWIIVLACLATWCVAIMLVHGVNPWEIQGWEIPEDFSRIIADSDHPSRGLPAVMFEKVMTSLFLLQLLLLQSLHWGPMILEKMISSQHFAYRTVCVGLLLFIIGVSFYVLPLIKGTFICNLLSAAESDEIYSWKTSLVSGELCVAELKKIFQSMDEEGRGYVKRDDFLKGIHHMDAFLTKFELNPDKARVIFRLLDDNKSGMITVDDFIINCLTIVTNKTRESVCTDYMHRKVRGLLHKLRLTGHYQLELLIHQMHKTDREMHKISHRAVNLCRAGNLRDWNPYFEDEDNDVGDQASAKSSTRNQMMLDLDERFSFRSRLDKLAASVHEQTRDLRMREDLGEDVTGKDGSVETSPNSIEHLWNEVLHQEALPWFRKRTAAAAAAAASAQADEEAERLREFELKRKAEAEKKAAAVQPAADARPGQQAGVAKKEGPVKAVNFAATIAQREPTVLSESAPSVAEVREEEDKPARQPSKAGWSLPSSLLSAVRGNLAVTTPGIPGYAAAPPRTVPMLFTPVKGDLANTGVRRPPSPPGGTSSV